MYDLNLPTSDLTPHLRRAHRERAEAVTRLLRGGVGAIWRAAVDTTHTAKTLAAAASATHARRRLRRETIRELRGLNDRTLQDIGVPRGAIWSVAEDLVTTATMQEPRPQHRPVTPDSIRRRCAQTEAVVRLPANRNQRSGRIAAVQALAGCG